MHGGQLMALYQPSEVLIICGAALGAMIIANPASVSWGVVKSAGALMTPSKYNKEMYLDLLTMMYDIFNKTRRERLMSTESDIDEPATSTIFSRYPALLKDTKVINFICDYLRIEVVGS